MIQYHILEIAHLTKIYFVSYHFYGIIMYFIVRNFRGKKKWQKLNFRRLSKANFSENRKVMHSF